MTNAAPVDPDAFKAALGTWPAGVTIVTTEDDGLVYGLTVSSFSSLSFDPLLVMVCINNTNHFVPMAERSRQFAVSILAQGQEELSNHFASSGRDPLPTYDEWGIDAMVTGCPVFAGAAAHLDCELEDMYPGGDHTIVVGRVVGASSNVDAEPLVYYRRKYRTAL
jgi:flavin reductase (NADH)